MIFSFIFLPLAAHYYGIHISLPPAEWYVAFVSNYYSNPHVYFLRFLWSLSVEEQFYLVLGICLTFFQKHLNKIFISLIIVSTAFNIYGVIKGLHIYFNTLTYLFDFSLGALASWQIRYRNSYSNWFKALTKIDIAGLYISFPVLIVVFYFLERNLTPLFTDIIDLLCRLIFIVTAAAIISDQMINDRSFFPFKNSFLIYTGKISHGLYCFHGIVLTFGSLLLNFIGIKLNGLLNAFIFLAADYMVAWLSYYFFEAYFLRLKEKVKS